MRFTLSRATPIIASGPTQAVVGAINEALYEEPSKSTVGEALVRMFGFPVSKSSEEGGRFGISDATLESILNASR